MRGRKAKAVGMFSYISTEDRIPEKHPLRTIKPVVEDVLAAMSRRLTGLYAREGRPSIPPEQLMAALLLQALYGVRSERMLMEQMNYNLLFRWFVGLSPDDEVWDASSFSKNRDRLLAGEVFSHFLAALLAHAKVAPLLSDEHFSVDGTLIEAWASHKSFKPKDDSGDGDGQDFHGQKRTNDTHASTTDPEAKLYKKAAGKEAKLSYMGHALMENRNGLAVGGMVTQASGTAERDAAEALIEPKAKRKRRITLGADKAYDAKEHVANLRALGVTAHVAQNDANRKSAIDGRTTRHVGYAMSQTCRKALECVFGWGKQHGTLRKAKLRGLENVASVFDINLVAYNLARLPKLLAT